MGPDTSETIEFIAAPDWLRRWAAPLLDLTPWTPADIDVLLRGEPEADDLERLLVWSARARGAIDLCLGEGLDALGRGDRLASLGFHRDDYAREALDLNERTAADLTRLARELRARPLLRAALRSGRVRVRAAQTVLPVAMGEAEAIWVERAARLTVRQLEAEVRKAGADPGDADEPWLRLCAQIDPDERAVVDAALDLARELIPGVSRSGALEAIAQEFLAEFPGDPDEDAKRRLGGSFRPIGPGEEPRRAALEAEMEDWIALPQTRECETPDVPFDDTATAQAIDTALRDLARCRAGWDDIVGQCADALQRSRMHVRLGFATFRHYVEERLQLPARTVEQRAALYRRLSASPALREARRQKLPYEKQRVLATLSEKEIGSWTPRAHALTCIDLRRKVQREKETADVRARRISAPVPRAVAVLLAAAVEEVRARFGPLAAGKCLAIIAWHFLETWQELAHEGRSRSHKVRERDGGFCVVPGCSHMAADAHHIQFRSHGGSDEMENQISCCKFHHLRCIHGGHLRVVGRAPDQLTWFLHGQPWTGRE